MADLKTPDSPAEKTVTSDVPMGGEPDTVPGELTTLHNDGVDIVFEEQAALINHAVQAIGMGRYQWALFVLCGYGWMCDQVPLLSSNDHPVLILIFVALANDHLRCLVPGRR